MSITTEQARTLGSGKVVTTSGAKIGNIGQVYLDDTTGDPAWVTVKTGLFDSSESFVPLQDAQLQGSDVVVGYDEDKVKNAPRVEADGSITPQEEDELYSYYGLSSPDAGGAEHNTQDVSGTTTDTTTAAPAPVSTGGRYTDTETDRGTDVPSDADDLSEVGDDRADISDRTVGADRSGPTTDDAMTRSEERLKVGTATREAGRARLRKFVTTETVTQTVPVRHEEVTLTREPITADNYDASQSGPDLSEEEHEVVLHEEVPVVEKDVVAVERVKLDKQTVTEQATVSDEVRKENIEMVDPTDVAAERDQSGR